MPVYQYRCKSCGKTHDIEHGFYDERPTKCPSCGSQLVRVFHPVGVVFKGSGFHKTDYTSSGVRKEPASAGSSSETAKSDGKAADAKQPDSKSAASPKTTEGASSSGASSPKATPKSGDSSSTPGSSKP